MKRLEDMTEPELSGLMKSLAKKVEEVCLSRGVGRPMFTLLLFNDPKVGQYVSNCDRASMVEALRETADRLERKQDVPRDGYPEYPNFP